MMRKSTDKPSSVVGRSSILDRRCRRSHATYPEARRAAVSLPVRSCSGWSLQSPSCHQEGGGLLPRLSTLTMRRHGGLFLLHWSGSRLHWMLSSILPYGARTFLTGALSGPHRCGFCLARPSGRLAHALKDTTTRGKKQGATFLLTNPRLSL